MQQSQATENPKLELVFKIIALSSNGENGSRRQGLLYPRNNTKIRLLQCTSFASSKFDFDNLYSPYNGREKQNAFFSYKLNLWKGA